MIFQVEQVVITKGRVNSSGTVHLTAHHLIFHYEDSQLGETWVSWGYRLKWKFVCLVDYGI